MCQILFFWLFWEDVMIYISGSSSFVEKYKTWQITHFFFLNCIAGRGAQRQGSPGVRQTSDSSWSPSGESLLFTSDPYNPQESVKHLIT